MNEFLARLPSTNFRVFVGVTLAVLYVLSVLVAAFAWPERVPDVEVLKVLQWTVLGILGIDTLHFAAKRATHKEDRPPSPTDYEDRAGDEPEHGPGPQPPDGALG